MNGKLVVGYNPCREGNHLQSFLDCDLVIRCYDNGRLLSRQAPIAHKNQNALLTQGRRLRYYCTDSNQMPCPKALSFYKHSGRPSRFLRPFSFSSTL